MCQQVKNIKFHNFTFSTLPQSNVMDSPPVDARLHGAIQLVRHSLQLDQVRTHT